MLDKLSFKNFKIFKERQKLELKPITVIIGKNNSGKSAIVKLPTLINASLQSTKPDILNVLNNDIELGAELRDLVYGKANRAIEFELENNNPFNKLSLSIYISEDDNGKPSSILESWKLNSDFEAHEVDEKKYIDKTGKKINVSFKGFNILGDVPSNVSNTIKDFAFCSDYIGPIRIQPQRDYRLNHSTDNKVGIKGENAYQILIADALTTEQKIIKAVSKWYKENFEGWSVRVNQDKNPVFQIEIQREDLVQNIVDAGIGMSQALPIITRAMAKCEENTLIIIEEPETHLHPAAHGNLAELLVNSWEKDPNKRYLVETHSLNFILRLRRLVAQKRLNRKDLKIYHVDFLEDKNYSVLNEIVVHDDGSVESWPEDIFKETLNETIAIRTAQLENK